MGEQECQVLVKHLGSDEMVPCSRPRPCLVIGHEPLAPEGCGPAERCPVVVMTAVELGGVVRESCGNPLPCPEHGPENAGGGGASGSRRPLHETAAPSGSAPERRAADDDLAGLAHDLCAAMEAGADPEGLRGLLVARGWRPPGEARPVAADGYPQRSPHGNCHADPCRSTRCPCWTEGRGEGHPIDRDALRARVAVIIGDAHPSTMAKADAVLDLLAQEGDHGTT